MFKWFPSILLKSSHLALIALWVTLVTACSPTPLPDALLSVTPQTLLLEAGATAVPLTATVQNSNSEVKWALEGEGTLSSLKGKITNYTPPATLNTALSAKITATLEGTKLSQLVSVTFTPKPKLVITPPTDLSNVIAGGPKIRFSAAISSGVSGAKNKQAKQPRLSPLVPSLAQWSLEGPGNLNPSQGEFTDYTPPTEVNTATPVKLTVRLGTLEQTFSFNIQPKPLEAALSLSPSSQTVTAGTVGTVFTATLFNSTEALSWSLTGLGTLSSTTGETVTYTPPSSVSKTETAMLTVRAGALSQQATLTLQPAPKLSVSPSSATFTAGDAGQSFTATLENSSEPINWSLEGVGSLSSTIEKTVTYTPPSSVVKDETVKLTARAGTLQQSLNLVVRVKQDSSVVTGLVTIGDMNEQKPFQGYKVGILGRSLVISDQNGEFRLEGVVKPYNLIVIYPEKTVKVFYGLNDDFLRVYLDKPYSNAKLETFTVNGKVSLVNQAQNLVYPASDYLTYKIRPGTTNNFTFAENSQQALDSINGFSFNSLSCQNSLVCGNQIDVLRRIKKSDHDIGFEFGSSGIYNFSNGNVYDVGIISLKSLPTQKFTLSATLPSQHRLAESYITQYKFKGAHPVYSFVSRIEQESNFYTSYLPKFDDGSLYLSISTIGGNYYGAQQYSYYTATNLPNNTTQLDVSLPTSPRLDSGDNNTFNIDSMISWQSPEVVNYYDFSINSSALLFTAYTKNNYLTLPNLSQYGFTFRLNESLNFGLGSSFGAIKMADILKTTYNMGAFFLENKQQGTFSGAGFRNYSIRLTR